MLVSTRRDAHMGFKAVGVNKHTDSSTSVSFDSIHCVSTLGLDLYSSRNDPLLTLLLSRVILSSERWSPWRALIEYVMDKIIRD